MLDDSRKGKFLNTALRIIVLSEETSDEIKKDMFERINNGSDLLKPMEKRKGVFIGPFNDFIYDYCKRSGVFKELIPVSKWLEKRQEQEELLLRFFALSENDAYMYGCDIGIAKYLDSYIEKKNTELSKLGKDEREILIKTYETKIDNVCEFVRDYFPFGFRHAVNPETKRSVFEAISVGVDKYIQEGNSSPVSSKSDIEAALKCHDFKKYTHVANELHKKHKLNGRVQFIYKLLKDGISK